MNKITKLLAEWKLKQLKKLPRYQSGSVSLGGDKFLFVDGKSFYYGYKAVIGSEIYQFECKRKDPIIIDCGAYVGLAEYYFGKKYPKAKITAFEADPKIYKVLKKNIRNWKLKNVELINKAVWNKKTKLSFYQEGADSGRVDKKGKVKIDAISLKDFIKKKERIDLLMMDIEGAEVMVLKDCKDELKKIDNLFVEYHRYKDDKDKLGDLLEILKASKMRFFIQTEYCPNKPLKTIVFSEGMDLRLNIFAKKSR